MRPAADPALARRTVRTIQMLAVDAVERAASGHPGMPMGAADVAYVLWSRYLRFDPSAPDWPDRDRFVLSAGHGCMLLYALLHLAGYDLTLDDLKRFRQLGSRTPGHPEFGHTPGVEATTGPLGQGVGNAVGMALAARMLAERFPGHDAFRPVGHRVFALASDGDLMEGVSAEASSLAGHLGLGNLVVLYDDNRITIEGSTSLAWSEDVLARYAGYGWHTAEVDGHDHDAIAAAIETATGRDDRPSIIRCRTHIAHGAPNKQDTAGAHGAPLGADEVAATKRALEWPEDPTFRVPDDVRAHFAEIAAAGTRARGDWEAGLAKWRADAPDTFESWRSVTERRVPDDVVESLVASAPAGDAATRAHGGEVLQRAAELVPALVGGSADLAPSNKSTIDGSDSVAPGAFSGRNLHFGVREHAMGAIVNGATYYGAFRPYGATFLVFSDYMRPSIRLSALAGLPAIWLFTHDSIFVGEDGPTHQPIEHLAALRVIPNLDVWRPADGVETAVAWGAALERREGPTAIVLTRQKVPAIERPSGPDVEAMRRGAYAVRDVPEADVVVVATGSEVHLALAAAEALDADGVRARVVSMPCAERFAAQPADLREALLPEGVRVAAVEAGQTDLWRVWTGRDGLVVGIDRFGASAPGADVAQEYGMTAEAVTARLRAWLGV